MTTNAIPTDLPTVSTSLFIHGAWMEAEHGSQLPVINPATEKVIAHVADAGVGEANQALDAAVRAQRGWGAMPPRRRSEILYRAFEILVDRTEEFALLITLEMGKPLAEARGEVAYAAEFFRWFAEEAVRVDGGYAHRPDGAARIVVHRQPVGPCLLITPWNFPLAMGTRKIGPAIAAGCTMVLKPAPQTPLSSLALAQVLTDAGLPPGVLNVITTSRAAEVVEPLLRSGAVRKLSFTGSTQVGRLLLEQSASAVVRTSMELGGNAPFLVLADADLDVAVEAAVQAKMRNMGEACTAANRFLVHHGVADVFARRLAERMGNLTVGRGDIDEADVGPLIDNDSRAKVLALVADAVHRGADLLLGGTAVSGPGYFVEPTVLVNIDESSDLLQTEIFGPVAALQTFTSIDEAIERANDTAWGLVAYLMTRDLNRALDVSERLEVGMVGLNTGVVSTPSAPFGGIKQSGIGREGGRVGIDEFLETKYISIPVAED